MKTIKTTEKENTLINAILNNDYNCGEYDYPVWTNVVYLETGMKPSTFAAVVGSAIRKGLVRTDGKGVEAVISAVKFQQPIQGETITKGELPKGELPKGGNNSRIKLRDYQKEDKTNILHALGEGDSVVKGEEQSLSVLYQLPTGGGKSVILADIILDWVLNHGKRILFMVHRRKLLDQMYNYLNDKGIEVGILYGKSGDTLNKQVVLCSINTAQRPERIMKIAAEKFDYTVIDEAHRAASLGYKKVIKEQIERNPKLKLLGVTATPYRLDKKDLSKIFAKLVNSIKTVKDLVAEKYLTDFTIYSTPTKDFVREVDKNSGGDYNMAQLSKYMRKDELLDYAVESYETYAKGKQVLIYCVDVEHAKKTLEWYKNAGYDNMAYIDGNTSDSERNKIFKGFEGGKVLGIVSIDVLTEGIDLPDCNCIQSLRPTKSLTLYLQQIGRGMRPDKNDEKLIILDNAMNCMRHGTPSTTRLWSLNSGTPPTPKDKNRVLVKVDAEGGMVLLDEDEELEFGEVREISFEEAIENSTSLLDLAEKKNEKRIKEYYSEFLGLMLWVMELANEKDKWDVDKRHTEDEIIKNGFYIRSIKFNRKLENEISTFFKPSIQLSFDNDGRLILKPEDLGRVENYEEGLEMMQSIGNISKYILKNRKHIEKKRAIFSERKEDLIDVLELKENLKEKQVLILEKKINQVIKAGKSIKTTEVFDSYGDLGIDDGWGCSHKNKWILRFVNQSGLLVKNRVVFQKELQKNDGTVEIYNHHYSKYIKKERILEWLSYGYTEEETRQEGEKI